MLGNIFNLLVIIGVICGVHSAIHLVYNYHWLCMMARGAYIIILIRVDVELKYNVRWRAAGCNCNHAVLKEQARLCLFPRREGGEHGGAPPEGA